MKKYVGLGGRGGREKPPAPASPLGASSNPLGKPGTWGEGAQGASGDPPHQLWDLAAPPPPCCCCAGPKWISCTSPAPCTPPAAPQHPALPRPPPRCPPCCSPGCQSSIFGPLPLQFMARSGGDCTPLYPPFPCPAPCKARRRLQGPGALRPQTTARHSRQGRAERK